MYMANSRKSKSRAVVLCAVVLTIASTAVANTFVTFSVDMSNQVASATFTPGVDIVSVNGTFNGWALPPNLTFMLVRSGSTTIYTNTVNDTVDANDGQIQWKFVIDANTWENTADLHNRASRMPALSGASLVLPKAYFSDAGPTQVNLVTFQVDMTQHIKTGSFNPNTQSVS